MSSPTPIRSELHESLVGSSHVPKEAEAEVPQAIDRDFTGWFQTVVEQFEGPLIRYARRITGDLERARDVVQETLLQLYRQDRTSIRGAITPWLFRVCRNRALDVQRKEQLMSSATELDLQSLQGGTGPEERFVQTETSDRLLGHLESLPENQQEVIRLKFQSDLSYREIAEITGMTVSNVGVLLHTGLKKLRRMMNDGNPAG